MEEPTSHERVYERSGTFRMCRRPLGVRYAGISSLPVFVDKARSINEEYRVVSQSDALIQRTEGG